MSKSNASNVVAVGGTIPNSSISPGLNLSGWVRMSVIRDMIWYVAIDSIAGAATLQARIVQAQDDAGTGKATVPGKETQVYGSGTADASYLALAVSHRELTNGNAWVALEIEVASQNIQVAAFGIGTEFAHPPAFKHVSKPPLEIVN